MGVAERREREKRERRESILEAAERVFAERGVVDTTMDHIAQEAELSKGTLYLYFKNKDELYVSLAVRCLDDVLERFTKALAETEGEVGLRRVEALLRTYIEFGTNYPNRLRVAMNWISSDYSLPRDPDELVAYREAISRVMVQSMLPFELGQRDGSVRGSFDPSAQSFQVWGSTIGLLMLRARADETEHRMGGELDFDGLIEQHIEMVIRGIAADPSLLDGVASTRRQS